MSLTDSLLPEFDREMASTRSLLERVPEDDARWRPHPKSSTLGDLAVHITRLPLWGRYVFAQTELDLGLPENASIARAEFSTTAELLERFDRHVAEGHAALAKASDGDMGAVWSLKNAGAVVLAMPRSMVFRSFVMSHLIHHRGQLSVYLRLRDVPLPSLYGPTADTR
ncbi:MAG TPA: DinB family protein [Gemmatimonadales bacterium]